MVAYSSAERREKQWKELIESSEFKISKILNCDGTPEKLIEVKLT
jgi:hypothetical protein